VVADTSGGEPEVFFITNRPVRHGPVANGTAACSSAVGAGPNETADVAMAPDYYAVPSATSTTSAGASVASLPRHAAVVQHVGRGVHVLSNSTLNDASWAKVAWVREQLTGVAAAVPYLAELRARYGAPRRSVGAEHASDMGLPTTARGGGGFGAGGGDEGDDAAATLVGRPAGVPAERAEALAHRAAAAARQHTHHAWDGDADVEQRCELALVQDVLQRVVGVM
jgi:hypothetical protein